MNRTRIAVLALVLSACCAASGMTPTEQRALELAKETLAAVQAGERALETTKKAGLSVYEREFKHPLERARGRWDRAPFLTDKDKAPHLVCAMAVDRLLNYAMFVRQGAAADAAQYQLDRFREERGECEQSIRHPDRYRIE